MAQGFYLDATTYVIPGDGVYKWMDDRSGGLGKFDWNKIIDLATPIAGAFAGYLAGKSQRYPDYSRYGYQTQGGVVVTGTPAGATGSIDTTTIILIAGIGLVALLALKR